MKRRKFLHQSAKASAAVSLFGALACKGNEKKETSDGSPDSGAMAATAEADLFFDLSLGQWSINRMIRNDGVDPYTFAEKAKGWGFTGLEYVSALYYGVYGHHQADDMREKRNHHQLFRTE